MSTEKFMILETPLLAYYQLNCGKKFELHQKTSISILLFSITNFRKKY